MFPSCFCLFTTMGIGKVRMNTPERAQKPPMIFPVEKNEMFRTEGGDVVVVVI